MLVAILLALQASQPAAPELEELAGVELPDWPLVVSPSRGGKFVLAASKTDLQVLSGGTLKPLKLLGPASAGGFDEKEEALTVVDTALRRLDTREWKESSKIDLEDADAAAPGRAFVDLGGNVYYRNRDGWVSLASFDGGRLVSSAFERPERMAGASVERFWGQAGAAVLVTLSKGEGAILLGRRIYTLPLASEVLAMGDAGGKIAVVCRQRALLFDAATYKCAWASAMGHNQENTAAAVDAKTGTVFVRRDGGLRAFRVAEPEKDWAYDAIKDEFETLVVDPAARVLYGAAGKKIRSWKIK